MCLNVGDNVAVLNILIMYSYGLNIGDSDPGITSAAMHFNETIHYITFMTT